MNDNGRYYADGFTIRKAPIVRKMDDGGERITVGFPVCVCSEYIGEDGARTVARFLNFAEYSDPLPEGDD